MPDETTRLVRSDDAMREAVAYAVDVYRWPDAKTRDDARRFVAAFDAAPRTPTSSVTVDASDLALVLRPTPSNRARRLAAIVRLDAALKESDG